MSNGLWEQNYKERKRAKNVREQVNFIGIKMFSFQNIYDGTMSFGYIDNMM